MGHLFLAELSRAWMVLRRYPLPTLGYLAITFITFYGLFLGSRYLAGPVMLMGSRLDGLVVGYIVWSLSLSAVADISLGLQEDMHSGTLEHIYLSPFGPTVIYLVRGLAQLLMNLVSTLGLTLLFMLAMNHWLQWRPLVIPAGLLTLVSAYGFSMFFGGLTLLYKRLGGLFSLVQFTLLYLVMIPVENQPLEVQVPAALLPITPTVVVLRDVLSESGRVEPLHLALALGNAVLYMSVGLLLFRQADRRMRMRGSLNQF